MSNLSRWTLGTFFLPVGAMAGDGSAAYRAGYEAGHSAGQQAMQIVGPFLPYVGIALLVLAAWLGWRTWSKRRRPGKQA